MLKEKVKVKVKSIMIEVVIFFVTFQSQFCKKTINECQA